MLTRLPANQAVIKACLTTSPSRSRHRHSLVSLVGWPLLMVLLAPLMAAQAQGYIQQVGATNPFNTISTRGFGPAVTLADLDGDGDLDLPTVDPNGTIVYYQNTGTPTAPSYAQAASPIGLPTEGVQYFLGFRFADLDGDGDLDAVTGNSDGVILFYRNTGTRTSPSFTQLTGSNNPFAAFRYTNEDYSTVAPADFDGDGDVDVLVLTGSGNHYLRNGGSATVPAYTEVTGTGNPFAGVVEGDAFFIPAAADMDRDGDLDLAVTDYVSSSIRYYQNIGSPTSPVFIRLNGPANPFDGFVQDGYLTIGLGDVYGDGDVDAVAGVTSRSYGGPLIYLRNSVQMPQQPTPASQTVCVGGSASSTVQARSGGAITYQWYRNAQNTATPVAGQINATLQLTNVRLSDAGVYYARASGDGGTLYSTAFTLEVQGVSIAQQPVSGSSVCAGTMVTASASASGTVTGYQWYRNGTIVSGQTSATLTLPNTTPAQSGSYSVAVTSSCSSITSTAFSLIVNALPTAYAVTGGGTSCAGGAGVVVGLSDSQTGVNYQLLRGGSPTGETITGTGNSISFLPPNTAGTYTVQATNPATNCTKAMNGSANIVVNTPPSVSITPSATAVCDGQRATLTATPGLTSYVWSNGQTTASISVSASGTYSVTATHANGCSASASASVTVNTPPIASLLVSGPLTCQQTSATLTAGGGSSYGFSSGANQIANGPTATVTTAGVYSVTVLGANGCSSVASTTVTSDQTSPTVSINPTTALLSCATPGVILTATTSANSLLWSTGQTTSNISVSVAGTYSLTVTGLNGCLAMAQATVSGTTNAPTAPTLAASPAAITTNQPITVTANGCTGGMINWTAFGGTGQASGNTYMVSQPGNYTLSATCSLNGCTSSSSSPLSVQIRPGGFAITGVSMVNCQLTDEAKGGYQVQFTPQYAGQNTSPISFSVVNELAATTAPAPYTLRLYTDNPVITLVATQAGNGEARFAYNWLASCQSGTSPNQPPTTAGIPNQSILVGQAYQLQLTTYFSDPDGQVLSFQASGLPQGLTLSGSSISGVPSQTGVSTVSVTALDPLALTVSTSFQLTVNPIPVTPPTGFAIVGVSTVNCQVISPGERRLTFIPQYAGVSGVPISFSVVNELLPTTAPGPYSLNLYTDNPTITLKAQQGSSLANFSYNWLAACSASGRQGAPEVSRPLRVTVLGNPVQGQQVVVEVRGAEGQPLQLTVTNLQGQVVSERVVEQAGWVETQSLPVSAQPAGLLLLRVSTPRQSQITKVLNQ